MQCILIIYTPTPFFQFLLTPTTHLPLSFMSSFFFLFLEITHQVPFMLVIHTLVQRHPLSLGKPTRNCDSSPRSYNGSSTSPSTLEFWTVLICAGLIQVTIASKSLCVQLPCHLCPIPLLRCSLNLPFCVCVCFLWIASVFGYFLITVTKCYKETN